MHTQRHDVKTGDASADVYRDHGVLEFNASWGYSADQFLEGAEFQFADAPAVITYADGSKVEVRAKIEVKQIKKSPGSVYPGLSARPTANPWEYDIRKDITVWGVPMTEHVAFYDATPRIRPLPLGQVYKMKAPADGYESLYICLALSFPPKPMDIDIDIPTVKIASKPLQAIHFHIHYTDKWEILRLAP